MDEPRCGQGAAGTHVPDACQSRNSRTFTAFRCPGRGGDPSTIVDESSTRSPVRSRGHSRAWRRAARVRGYRWTSCEGRLSSSSSVEDVLPYNDIRTTIYTSTGYDDTELSWPRGNLERENGESEATKYR